jgi:hypothetical protein
MASLIEAGSEDSKRSTVRFKSIPEFRPRAANAQPKIFSSTTPRTIYPGSSNRRASLEDAVLKKFPSLNTLRLTDPFLKEHPGKGNRYWDEYWVIGIAVIRLRTVQTAWFAPPRSVIEVLIVKRSNQGYCRSRPPKDDATFDSYIKKGPSEQHFPNHWAIPTAYVEPKHSDAYSTLASKLWEDLGLPAKNILGSCGSTCWAIKNTGDERHTKFRQITYIVTTHVDDKVLPNQEEYSEWGWIGLELLDKAYGVRMTNGARSVLSQVFNFADIFLLE